MSLISSTSFKTLLSSTLLVLTLGLQSTAYAADAKEYPGAACNPWTTEDDNKDWTRLNNKFTSFSNISVWCPIVRDNATNRNGIDYAFIRIYRKPGNRSPGCGFYNYKKFGQRGKSEVYSNFPEGWSFRKYTLNSSFTRGSYGFFCDLRNGDSVGSYKVSEN